MYHIGQERKNYVDTYTMEKFIIASPSRQSHNLPNWLTKNIEHMTSNCKQETRFSISSWLNEKVTFPQGSGVGLGFFSLSFFIPVHWRDEQSFVHLQGGCTVLRLNLAINFELVFSYLAIAVYNDQHHNS